jgi:hypothetical protein
MAVQGGQEAGRGEAASDATAASSEGTQADAQPKPKKLSRKKFEKELLALRRGLVIPQSTSRPRG